MTLIERARQFLATRRQAYRKIFAGPYSEIVLQDLAVYCFARHSPKLNDTDLAIAEGRRQVWNRIASHLNLTEEQCWQLYDGRADVQEG